MVSFIFPEGPNPRYPQVFNKILVSLPHVIEDKMVRDTAVQQYGFNADAHASGHALVYSSLSSGLNNSMDSTTTLYAENVKWAYESPVVSLCIYVHLTQLIVAVDKCSSELFTETWLCSLCGIELCALCVVHGAVSVI